MAEKPFEENWREMGRVVQFARSIVSSGPSSIVDLIRATRAVGGTEAERELISAMASMRSAAQALILLADATSAMLTECAKLADGAALSALSAGSAH